MAGIFGIEGQPAKGTPEHSLRQTIRRAVALSTRPEAQLVELLNLGSDEPVGPLRLFLSQLDRHMYAVIGRAAPPPSGRPTSSSLLLDAETEDGERLTDQELRDELLTLVLAGHETTANSLAWAFERLLRHPAAYDRLRDVARSDDDPDGYVEATIHETMRSRPVIPIIGRRVTVPWQLGEYRMPAEHAGADEHPAAASPRGRLPGAVRLPPRALRRRASPGPTPGSRSAAASGAASAPRWRWPSSAWSCARSPGARPAARPTRAPSTSRHRNVTMIPAAGARVVMTARRTPPDARPRLAARADVGAAARGAQLLDRRAAARDTARRRACGRGSGPGSCRARRPRGGSRRSRRPWSRCPARATRPPPRAAPRSRSRLSVPTGRSGWIRARNRASSA